MTPDKKTIPTETETPLTLHLGNEELLIHRRYEALSIANDVLIGVWFLVGSIFFLYPSLTYAGTILFIIGSVEMLIRPIIRLSRLIHLKKHRAKKQGAIVNSDDF